MRKTAAIIAIALVGVAGVWSVRGIAQTTASAPVSEIVIKGLSKTPVTFDGNVSKFEYADAAHASFANGHGVVDAYAKCSEGYLCFGFQIPDLSPFGGDDIVIMLDTKNDRQAAPDDADIRAYVRRKMENSRQQQGDGKKWADYYGDWEYRSALYSTGWEVEARIPLKSLGVAPDKLSAVGLSFRIWDNQPQKTYSWPAGANENKPDTWGKLVLEPE